MKNFYITFILILLFSSTSFAKSFKIGVTPYTNAIKILKTYEPLQIFIEKKLNTKVEIYSSSNYKNFFNNVENHEFDLIISSPHFAIIHIQDGFLPLCRYNTALEPVFAVLKNSKYKTIEDLKGAKIAAPSFLTATTMAGLKVLYDHNMKIDKDFTILDAQSHTNAIKSVLIHQSDVAITTYTPIKQLFNKEVQDSLRIIKSNFDMPHLFLLTNPNEKNINKIKTILQDFEKSDMGKEFFTKTGYVGYTPITDKDISVLTPIIEDTKKFLGIK